MTTTRSLQVGLVALVGAMFVVGFVPAVSHAGAGDARRAGKAATIVRVVALDYAFQSPDSVAAGSVAFEFENRGQRFHELMVGLLRPGVTASDIASAHQRGINFRQLTDAYLAEGVSGMLFAEAGELSPAQLVVPLARGKTYVLLCQLRDSLGKPQHVQLGMFRLLHAK